MTPTLAVELSAIASFASAARPELPVPDDGNDWEAGRCWLYCGRDPVAVMWIGPVTVAGATAPMVACAQCIAMLNSLVWEHLSIKDIGTVPNDPGPSAVTDRPVVRAVAYSRTPAIAGARSRRRKPKRTALIGRAVGDRLARLRRRKPS
nr:hypothetical protein KPHV_29400 [Kitasatospora purpeofusca]